MVDSITWVLSRNLDQYLLFYIIKEVKLMNENQAAKPVDLQVAPRSTGIKRRDVRFDLRSYDRYAETGLSPSWPQANPVFGRRCSLLRSACRALSGAIVVHIGWKGWKLWT
jgi:hypothetical protein